jgi:mono/diheme cytochrome c family protein
LRTPGPGPKTGLKLLAGIAHDPNLAPEGNEEQHLTTRIEVLTLAESPDGTGPIIANRQTLVTEDGQALYDPEPISLRAPIEIDAPPLPPSEDAYAIFSHQGVDIVDALLRSLSPSGKKELRSDAVYMRLVEHLVLPATARKVIDDEASGAVSTTSGLGVHGPSRVLAELPLAADGSVHVKVPVGVSFRVQLLDAQRMAVGAMHNRWYYALPGQTLVQGLSLSKGREAYATRCAACHGDLEGADTPPSLARPDAISGASLTLSRYEGQNPRRPIEPPLLTPEMGIDVDFVTDIQPILDRHCIACHADENKAPGLDLRGLPTANFSRSYETLLKSGDGSGHGRAYVDADEGRARSSYLIELLRGAELEAPRVVPALGRVHPGGPQAETGMSEEEFLQIVRWIELGATFRGSTKP